MKSSEADRRAYEQRNRENEARVEEALDDLTATIQAAIEPRGTDWARVIAGLVTFLVGMVCGWAL